MPQAWILCIPVFISWHAAPRVGCALPSLQDVTWTNVSPCLTFAKWRFHFCGSPTVSANSVHSLHCTSCLKPCTLFRFTPLHIFYNHKHTREHSRVHGHAHTHAHIHALTLKARMHFNTHRTLWASARSS